MHFVFRAWPKVHLLGEYDAVHATIQQGLGISQGKQMAEQRACSHRDKTVARVSRGCLPNDDLPARLTKCSTPTLCHGASAFAFCFSSHRCVRASCQLANDCPQVIEAEDGVY